MTEETNRVEHIILKTWIDCFVTHVIKKLKREENEVQGEE